MSKEQIENLVACGEWCGRVCDNLIKRWDALQIKRDSLPWYAIRARKRILEIQRRCLEKQLYYNGRERQVLSILATGKLLKRT